LAKRVNQAIDRGVQHLRKKHSVHECYRNDLGLLGLTLLECGVPASDPSVQQIARLLRGRQRDLMATYELTLAILFLDRLNDSRDRQIIRTFGQHLVAGQLDCGAWTYSCAVSDRRKPVNQLLLAPQGPSVISWSNGEPLAGRRAPARIQYHGDNSNTQFAILGLWVAQRHGVSARRALLATEQYFRQTQRGDGSWTYRPNSPTYPDSMSCAALMSLAMRHGIISGQGRDIRPDQPVLVSDRAIHRGLRYLGRTLGKITLAGDRITGVEARDPLYFLWSLERMAVIYDLKTIGETEWYPWAAEILVEIQQADGSWRCQFSAPVGTCFALLILKRSNLAHDLQLTVQSPPGRGGDLDGPTILQGPDAALGPTTTRPKTPEMQGTASQGTDSRALGPTVTVQPTPRPDVKRPATPLAVPELPVKK
jgi:hypothetical protein